jgi:hypothetical protein
MESSTRHSSAKRGCSDGGDSGQTVTTDATAKLSFVYDAGKQNKQVYLKQAYPEQWQKFARRTQVSLCTWTNVVSTGCCICGLGQLQATVGDATAGPGATAATASHSRGAGSAAFSLRRSFVEHINDLINASAKPNFACDADCD